MNKLIAFSILIIFTFSKNSYSANIAVIDIEDLIISNNFYIKIISEINLDQEYFSEIFKKKEKELEELKKEIDNAKLILDNQEINKMINNYNIELSKFSSKIDSFNLHYQDQIIEIRKLMLKVIIEIAENYAKNNNIDVILDESNYLIASNTLNITSVLKKELEKIEINLKFEKFEKN